MTRNRRNRAIGNQTGTVARSVPESPASTGLSGSRNQWEPVPGLSVPGVPYEVGNRGPVTATSRRVGYPRGFPSGVLLGPVAGGVGAPAGPVGPVAPGGPGTGSGLMTAPSTHRTMPRTVTPRKIPMEAPQKWRWAEGLAAPTATPHETTPPKPIAITKRPTSTTSPKNFWVISRLMAPSIPRLPAHSLTGIPRQRFTDEPSATALRRPSARHFAGLRTDATPSEAANAGFQVPRRSRSTWSEPTSRHEVTTGSRMTRVTERSTP